jgi:hypothetical protein
MSPSPALMLCPQYARFRPCEKRRVGELRQPAGQHDGVTSS